MQRKLDKERGGKGYRTRVLTLIAGMLYRALTAALIWGLVARTSQMNTSVWKCKSATRRQYHRDSKWSEDQYER